jgi:hypothetical protein
MERGTAYISREELSQPIENIWAQEIRDYLLGRLSPKRSMHLLANHQTAELVDLVPIRRWWIFEGKRYKMLDGPLVQNLDYVVRCARQLDKTFSPRLRLSDRSEGEVDWGQTLARGPHRLLQEYVVRSSGIGLNEDEHEALWGWMRWIADEWGFYIREVDIHVDIQWPNFLSDMQGAFTTERLRHWAHSAMRSRWPLLHGVVAESLRPALESEELDRIPLPANRASLFELLCLVRAARCVAPPPRELRWLNLDSDNNTIRLDGVRVYYQQSLDREVVLSTSEYIGALASAVEFFGVRIPKFIDLGFDFETTREGFNGLIIEAKSGSQQYDDTVAQLRTYRLARPRRAGGRYLIWGIVENRDRPDATIDDLNSMFTAADKTTDVWVFSSADAIPAVLSAARLCNLEKGSTSLQHSSA